MVRRFLNTSPSSPTSAVSQNCVSAERMKALMHTMLMMMIMMMKCGDTAEARRKYQLLCINRPAESRWAWSSLTVRLNHRGGRSDCDGTEPTLGKPGPLTRPPQLSGRAAEKQPGLAECAEMSRDMMALMERTRVKSESQVFGYGGFCKIQMR